MIMMSMKRYLLRCTTLLFIVIDFLKEFIHLKHVNLYYHLYGNLTEQYYNHRLVIVVLRTLYNGQNIYFEIIVSHQYICINLLLQLPIIEFKPTYHIETMIIVHVYMCPTLAKLIIEISCLFC